MRRAPYRSSNRLVMDLLAAIRHEEPVGVTRLLSVANTTHARLQELLTLFEARGWVQQERDGERSQWRTTEKGRRVLGDLRRIDATMEDYGLGL